MKLSSKIALLLFVLFASNYSFSQSKNYAKEAERLYASGLYIEAADAYMKASEKMSVKNDKAREKKAEFAFLSAECYRLLHNFPAAEQQYEKAILLRYHEKEPMVYFYLAEMQMAQCNHKKALANYKKYKELNPNDPLVKVRIESCEKYDDFLKNKTRHEMDPLTKLNTVSYEYAAVMNSRGTEIYFTSSRPSATGEAKDAITGEDYTDIFVTTVDRKGNYSEPQPLPSPVNTIDNEGAMCFDARGKMMYFTRCVVEDKMNMGCDLYVVEKKNNGWGEPSLIKVKDVDSTHVGHPAIHPDGKTLIFASNMAGGFGGVDLWMSTYDKRADQWSLPINLGPEINTAGNEVFPTFDKDGNLFYSSNGLVGLGGLDIFKAEKVGEDLKWTKPTNLGHPLNTCSDDYHITFIQDDEKGQRGFLSSNRAGSKGPRENPSQDIWAFFLPPINVDLIVVVTDVETGKPIPNMEVTVTGSDGSNYVMKTDNDGQVTMTEKEDGSRYIYPGNSFNIVVPGEEKKYLGGKDKFTTEGVETNTRVIREIQILNIEKPIRLPEVRYALGSWELQVIEGEINSKDSLNYLYEIMVEHPNIVVELGSHTDSRGNDKANRTLSEKRAQSCIDYLVNEKGLPKERFVPKGYGEDVPNTYYEINPETGDTTETIKLTEAYINKFKTSDKEKFEYLHQLNRRTECRILSFDFVAPEAPKPEE